MNIKRLPQEFSRKFTPSATDMTTERMIPFARYKKYFDEVELSNEQASNTKRSLTENCTCVGLVCVIHYVLFI